MTDTQLPTTPGERSAEPGGDTPNGTPLETLRAAAFVTEGDALVASRVARLVDAPTDTWQIATLALTVRAVREGSSALALDEIGRLTPERDRSLDDDTEAPTITLADIVAPPSSHQLADDLRTGPLVGQGVVHLEYGLAYLDRYYRDEVIVAGLLRSRGVAPVDDDALRRAGAALEGRALDDAQRAAVDSALTSATTVLTGGPGMGKTYTVAAMLVAARAALGDTTRIALAAPTGKAAARMAESLREADVLADNDALTLHRLLGYDRTNSQRFVHGRGNPLPHDVVVVDEASMISLSLMARLLEALGPNTRLVLVGDPDQLASVEAGSVLGDLVAGLDTGVIRLATHHRLTQGRAAVAEAFAQPTGDHPDGGEGTVPPSSERVLAAVDSPDDGVEFLETDAPDLTMLPHLVEAASRLREVAATGNAEAAVAQLRASRLLAAHRTGPFGVARWNRLIENALAERFPDVTPYAMYVGRPVIVTKNDRALGLFNGDSGVIIRQGTALVAAMETASGVRTFSPWRLGDLETMHAMTVHKAQGSQAEHVTVIVPPVGSRLLTREMLYTALTRATERLTVVGTREAVELAVETPILRASGLRHRLREQDG